MAILPALSCISYSTSSKERIGDIIIFLHFEEGNLLSETHNNTEIRNEYDENSTIATLISEEEMDMMSSGDDSDA